MSPKTHSLLQPNTPLRVSPHAESVMQNDQSIKRRVYGDGLAVLPIILDFHVANHSLSFPANNPHTGHAWSRARTVDGRLIGEPGNALARKPAPRFQGRYRRGSGPGRVSASEQRRRGAAP